MSTNSSTENAIFGQLFTLSNRLQVFLDQQLRPHGLTAKQFYLMIIIHSFGDHTPNIREAAERFGSSYQNVKQLSLKLSESGFLTIRQDIHDSRTKRLSLTEKAEEFWLAREDVDVAYMSTLFHGFDSKQRLVLLDSLYKLQQNIQQLSE